MEPSQTDTPEPFEDPASDARLIAVHEEGDIMPAYVGTPIGTLLACHNLGLEVERSPAPEMIVVTCMDQRILLDMPPEFAFEIKTAGANIEPVLFNVAFALTVSHVGTIAIIGHSDCAMTRVKDLRGEFIETMTSLGPLSPAEAERFYEAGARQFAFDDAVEQTRGNAANLQRLFPQILIAALYFDVHDGMLSQIAP